MMNISQGMIDNILGEIKFNASWDFTYHWNDGSIHTFRHVIKLQTMKTGCSVLHLEGGHLVVVSPGYRYVYEQPGVFTKETA